ncbi:MAG: MFS transporter [Betaproteobacteria bacterium]|nr:MFS transporter [Betaproteobacteria bacterium]
MPKPIYLNLSAFYFFYFAYLGAFAPFFALYLSSVGMNAVEIGVLMALPQLSRILAPHLWGWLADRSGRRIGIVRASGVAGTVAFLGVFAGESFMLLFSVLFLMTFLWSAALPLVEATTLSHLGDETARYGRIRVWGSVGFIAAVVAVGYLLDATGPRALLWVVGGLMLSMLLLSWALTEAPAVAHPGDDLPVWHIVRRPEVIAIVAASALMAAAHGPYYTFYTIHLVDHGYSKSLAGWLWALGVICEIGIFVWMSHLYRAFTLRRILITSTLLTALRFVVIGWGADSVWLLLGAQTLHAASFGAFHAAAIGVVHKLFRGRHQARGQAIYGSLAYGLGGTIGGLSSGYAWAGLGAGLTFSLAAVCALAAAGVLWRWLRAV